MREHCPFIPCIVVANKIDSTFFKKNKNTKKILIINELLKS